MNLTIQIKRKYALSYDIINVGFGNIYTSNLINQDFKGLVNWRLINTLVTITY